MCPLKREARIWPMIFFLARTTSFEPTIKAPLEPGEYTLELGLVCESLTWFSDRGIPPLKFIVYVGSTAGLSSP